MNEGAPAPGAGAESTVAGHPLRAYPVALTTEALALGWARTEEAPEGAAVVANQELSPRQRKGPPWIGFPGDGLYLSIVLRPAVPPEGEDLLWVLASLAGARALGSLGVNDVRIKWPDDLHVGGRKIGGVKVINQLAPGRIESAIVTFRINLNVAQDRLPLELKERATSVAMETGSRADPETALHAFLDTLDAVYDLGPSELLEGYRRRCETLGRPVRASLLPRGEVVGTATGVDAFGTLLIDAGGRTIGVNVDSLKRLEYLLASEP